VLKAQIGVSDHSVGLGLNGLLLDSADSLAGFDSELDVASITPGGAPRVLDEVVRGTVLGSIADGEDTMVKLSSASVSSEDTGFVLLEGGFVGLNGNGDGTGSDGSLEGIRVVGGDHGVAGDVNGGGLDGFVALSDLTGTGGVGVRGLGISGVLLEVSEGKGHGATIASVVKLGALNELFLREGDELFGGDEVSSLNGTGGGE